MRTHVDLFTGIGGFSLACEWAGVETIAFAEIDPYASGVLKRHWPNVRNYGDVRGFPSLSAWLLTAGVPCQPASVAGKRKGAADDRWLWPETLTVVENGSYEWLLFENPTGILSLNDGLEFERICAALEGKGYEVQPLVIPACAVGALHRRNRIWIVAHATVSRLPQRNGERDISKGQRLAEPECCGSNVADSECEQLRTVRYGEVAGAAREVESREEERKRLRPDVGKRSAAMAHANDAGSQGRVSRELRECSGELTFGQSGTPVSDTARERVNGRGDGGARRRPEPTNGDWWSAEPDVGRLADGVSDRVGKLRCLGNAIVPQVAYQLIKRMIEAEESCLA